MPTKAQQLTTQEERISHAAMSFAELGDALRKIRDEKLYTATEFKTFEEYCEGRWDMSDKHVYRLIKAAAVMEFLSGCEIMPTNEAQARAVAAVHHAGMTDDEFAEKAKMLWDAVIKAKGRITAKKIDEIRTEMAVEAQAKSVMNRLKDDEAPPTIAQARKLVGLNRTMQNRVWSAVKEKEEEITPELVESVRDAVTAPPTTEPEHAPPALKYLRRELERLERADVESLNRLRHAAEMGHDVVCTIPQGSALYVILKNGEFSLLKYESDDDGEYKVERLTNSDDLVRVIAHLNDVLSEYVPAGELAATV